jgi:hypothetical protein
MISSLTLCTVIADETMEREDIKSSIKGITKADKTFYVFYDNENERFEQTIEYKKSEEKSIYKISRINIDGPYYDGIMGYNVVKIRKESFPAPIDVLTFMVRGQYHLFGYNIKKNQIYAYRTFQIGADYLINNIAIISKKNRKEKDKEFDESSIPDEIDIEIIGPPGEYDYGSCSPDGKYCLLFSSEVTVIDLQKKALIKKNFGIDSIPEAEPDRSTEEGTIIGGSFNLSGEFLEMKWETNISGKLICRDKNKKVIKTIKIDLGKYIEE